MFEEMAAMTADELHAKYPNSESPLAAGQSLGGMLTEMIVPKYRKAVKGDNAADAMQKVMDEDGSY